MCRNGGCSHHSAGVRVTFLGASTPLVSVSAAACVRVFPLDSFLAACRKKSGVLFQLLCSGLLCLNTSLGFSFLHSQCS